MGIDLNIISNSNGDVGVELTPSRNHKETVDPKKNTKSSSSITHHRKIFRFIRVIDGRNGGQVRTNEGKES